MSVHCWSPFIIVVLELEHIGALGIASPWAKVPVSSKVRRSRHQIAAKLSTRDEAIAGDRD